MLKYLGSGYFRYNISFSATNYPIYGLNIPNKVLEMKMIWEFIIVAKGKLIIELLVSTLCVIDQRSDKEAENWWLLTKFYFVSKDNNFWIIGICKYGIMDLVDNPLKFTRLGSHIYQKTYIFGNIRVFFVFCLIATFLVKLTDLIPEKISQLVISAEILPQ